MEVFTTLCILALLVSASALPTSVEEFSGQISDEDIDSTASSSSTVSSTTTTHELVSSDDRFAAILSLNEHFLKRLETLENNYRITDFRASIKEQNNFWILNNAEIIRALKGDWDNLKGQLNHMNEKEAEPVRSDEFSEKFNDLSNILTSTQLDVLQMRKELISTGRNIAYLQSNVSALLGAAKQQPTYPVVQGSSAGAAAESPLLPQGCKDAQKKSGIVKVAPCGHQGTSFFVNCHDGWTIIQQRKDGSIDFYRSWSDYKRGFGNINGEFWIGLDKLHEITSSRLHELLIYLENIEGRTRTAKYDAFAIGGEEEKYALVLLGNYSGDAGDSLSDHAGEKFSTFDNDNDANEGGNCAEEYNAAWWYKDCRKRLESDLNGRLLDGEVSDESLLKQRIYWKGFNEAFLTKVQMMIRPVD